MQGGEFNLRILTMLESVVISNDSENDWFWDFFLHKTIRQFARFLNHNKFTSSRI